MTFVTTQPELLYDTASRLHSIGTAITAQNTAAASPTLGVVPAAADGVSALTATQFAAHAALYQEISAQASAIHDVFVEVLRASGASYADTEAANAAAAS